MATPERDAFDALMRQVDVQDNGALGPGDLGRLSIESMASRDLDSHPPRSRGSLRLLGAGVAGHAADLNEVGKVATLWQRCVSAVGAALEGSRNQLGRIPDTVSARTTLQLSANPAPGSIVLNLTAKSAALDEIEPGGMRPFFDVPRPLADRASETLLEMLSAIASASAPENDDLAARLQELGPRATTSLRALADVLHKAHFDVDATWAEPERPTARAQISSGDAGWFRDFVAGRDLEAIEEEIRGEIRTVSDIAKWQIGTASGVIAVDASALSSTLVRSLRVGQAVTLTAKVRTVQRPDGTATVSRQAVSLLVDQ